MLFFAAGIAVPPALIYYRSLRTDYARAIVPTEGHLRTLRVYRYLLFTAIVFMLAATVLGVLVWSETNGGICRGHYPVPYP